MFRFLLFLILVVFPVWSAQGRVNLYNKKALKVAVIDTGLDLEDLRLSGHLCNSGHHFYSGTNIADNIGHGTHVVGLIEKNAKNANYCLLIYKYYDIENKTANPFNSSLNEVYAIKQAILDGAKIINFSGGGDNFYIEEYEIIKNHPNITFIVAAGNEGLSLDSTNKYYPASYDLPNIIAVGNKDDRGLRVNSSNYGSQITVYEEGLNVLSTLPNGKQGFMTGTSMSTAVHTGKIIFKLAK